MNNLTLLLEQRWIIFSIQPIIFFFIESKKFSIFFFFSYTVTNFTFPRPSKLFIWYYKVYINSVGTLSNPNACLLFLVQQQSVTYQDIIFLCQTFQVLFPFSFQNIIRSCTRLSQRALSTTSRLASESSAVNGGLSFGMATQNKKILDYKYLYVFDYFYIVITRLLSFMEIEVNDE